MEPESIRIPGADGLTLHALVWSGEGVGMLLLHGFGNYRTVALDLRGHGDSDADPEGRYDHESMARDVKAAADFLGMERLVLIGHSMGGRVALRFAGAHPDRIAGLVVIDTGPELDARGTTRIRLETGKRSPLFDSLEEYEGLLSNLYPAARPETLARMARHGLRRRDDGRYERKIDSGFVTRQESVTEEQRRAWSEQESKALWDAIAKLPCPILVVRGAASDVLGAQTADRMVEAARNARLVEIPRAGHSVMVDNPDAFRDAVTDFVLGDA